MNRPVDPHGINPNRPKEDGMNNKRLAAIATAIALTATPAVALTAPASAMAASTTINWCDYGSPVAHACLHAGVWWNNSTSGVYWQWPECDGNPVFPCQSSEFGHYYLGQGKTDLWQTSDLATPVGHGGGSVYLCLHINYIVGRYGPLGASTTQWYGPGDCNTYLFGGLHSRPPRLALRLVARGGRAL